MNSDRINRWLTLVANIGMLIGLFLLIVEIDQNNELMQAQIEQSRSIDQLDPVELVQLKMLVSSEFYDFENLFSQYERGFVSDEYWRERIIPPIRARAFAWKLLYPPDGPSGRKAFKDEVERILRKSQPAPEP